MEEKTKLRAELVSRLLAAELQRDPQLTIFDLRVYGPSHCMVVEAGEIADAIISDAEERALEEAAK